MRRGKNELRLSEKLLTILSACWNLAFSAVIEEGGNVKVLGRCRGFKEGKR